MSTTILPYSGTYSITNGTSSASPVSTTISTTISNVSSSSSVGGSYNLPNIVTFSSPVSFNDGTSSGPFIYFDEAEKILKATNGAEVFGMAHFAQIVVNVLEAIEDPKKLAVYLTSPNEDERKTAEIIAVFRKKNDQK